MAMANSMTTPQLIEDFVKMIYDELFIVLKEEYAKGERYSYLHQFITVDLAQIKPFATRAMSLTFQTGRPEQTLLMPSPAGSYFDNYEVYVPFAVHQEGTVVRFGRLDSDKDVVTKVIEEKDRYDG